MGQLNAVSHLVDFLPPRPTSLFDRSKATVDTHASWAGNGTPYRRLSQDGTHMLSWETGLLGGSRPLLELIYYLVCFNAKGTDD